MNSDHDSGLVKDPVCGMLIDPATAAATSTYHGHVFHFCAMACKIRFDGVPDSYATPEPATIARAGCCS